MAKTKKPKSPPRETATRYRDDSGNLWDVYTHAECGGNGCARCGNLGFVKQAAIDFPSTETANA